MSETSDLRAALNDAVETLERLGQSVLVYATVIKIADDRVVLAGSGGDYFEAQMPSKLKLGVGDSVAVIPDSKQILRKAHTVPLGQAVRVEAVADGHLEIEIGGAKRIVAAGQVKAQEGDRIILDPSGHVAVGHIPQLPAKFDASAVRTNVCWDDIGGQQEAKREMISAIELPYQNRKLYEQYGRSAPKGILLFGPPGCGKTMLAKATATAIGKTHGADGAFFYIKGPEILDPYVGASEAIVRDIFERARRVHAQTGIPAVIFIDEADAILGKRGTRHAFMEKTIVPMFLTEMDGLEKSSALVILATNRQDQLDSAVTRDGRIDRKIRVARPSAVDAVKIFSLYLDGTKTANNMPVMEMSAEASARLYGDGHVIFADPAQGVTLRLRDIVSGAMINGIVNKAVDLALTRDIKVGKATGVTVDDLYSAVDDAVRQNRHLNHTETLMEMADLHGIEMMRGHGNEPDTA